MAKKDPVPLTKDEIEEELLNDNLIEAGGVDNDGELHQMSMAEKKNLLKGIKHSKEEFSNQPGALSSHQSQLSLAEFPSLAASGKKESQNRLKLPRKTVPTTRKSSDENAYKSVSLSDNDEDVDTFSLPFCIGDGAPPLICQRQLIKTKDPYYRMRHESDVVALKRIFSHHNQWKEAYTSETSKIESQALGKDISNTDDIGRNSPKSSKFEEKENDPYNFVSDSPKNPSKLYVDQRKPETSSSSGSLPHLNNRHGLRKTNRDSDCEEVEPILKNEEPKGNDSEWRMATHPRSKRNRKQFSKESRQETENVPEVEFEFTNRWDSRQSTWRGSPSGGSSSSIALPPFSSNQVEEEKVQCPICQKNFAISKVENHAATCEGFSVSPMDVEEEN